MRWKTRAIAMVVVVVLMAVSFVIPVSAISDDEVAAPSAILMEPNTGKILKMQMNCARALLLQR